MTATQLHKLNKKVIQIVFQSQISRSGRNEQIKMIILQKGYLNINIYFNKSYLYIALNRLKAKCWRRTKTQDADSMKCVQLRKKNVVILLRYRRL